jgi:dipeptidyl aminopeptidase/acylaminoacyl peptidase
MIPAYLTLPPGSTGKGLPAIVLPHGGPEARDQWGFDWLVQFLAARGYAVIQPNFRGSAGYGEKWLVENGFKSWETSIGDVTAAANWLSAQGIADPNRIAILGWSYGGYAALQSAALNPTLYKSVVAIAPVTDLQMLKDDFEHYSVKTYVAKYVGFGPHVALGSPLRRASAINAPVLLFHGDIDTNVGVAHSRKMSAALKSAGKSSEFIEFKGLDHQLRDNDARRQMLTKIGELLDRTIGK